MVCQKSEAAVCSRAYYLCLYGEEKFGVRKPCLRLFRPQPCCEQMVDEARLRPLKAGARLPHSKVGLPYAQR